VRPLFDRQVMSYAWQASDYGVCLTGGDVELQRPGTSIVEGLRAAALFTAVPGGARVAEPQQQGLPDAERLLRSGGS
jgi:hypothetical protein